MAVNTLATATLFQKMLDKVAVQEQLPAGWMPMQGRSFTMVEQK